MKQALFLLSLLIVGHQLISCEPAVSFEVMTSPVIDSLLVFVPKRHTPAPKDTSICFSKDDLFHVSLQYYDDTHNFAFINLGSGTFPHLYKTEWLTDTIHVFLFDVKTVESVPWDEIVDEYLVLQRYDFSKEDINELRDRLFYPPTPEMAQMHMWPRYGTINSE
jgi:hypothetical protein